MEMNNKNKSELLNSIQSINFSIIELAQYFLCTGSADIDDIILHVVGCMIGHIITNICYAKAPF